jgi:carbon monoxide dehydrogenase subunit G
MTALDGRRTRAARRVGLAALAMLSFLPGPALGAEEVAVASARVAASPATVWALLTDFDGWQQVFPSVTQLSVERVDVRRARLHTVSQNSGYTIRYTLATTLVPEERRLECALDPGGRNDLAELSLAWRVSPTPDGGSLIELRVRSNSGMPVPRFVERRMAERTARQSVAALASAAEHSVVVASSGH